MREYIQRISARYSIKMALLQTKLTQVQLMRRKKMNGNFSNRPKHIRNKTEQLEYMRSLHKLSDKNIYDVDPTLRKRGAEGESPSGHSPGKSATPEKSNRQVIISKSYYWNQELTQPYRESQEYKNMMSQVNEYQNQAFKARNLNSIPNTVPTTSQTQRASNLKNSSVPQSQQTTHRSNRQGNQSSINHQNPLPKIDDFFMTSSGLDNYTITPVYTKGSQNYIDMRTQGLNFSQLMRYQDESEKKSSTVQSKLMMRSMLRINGDHNRDIEMKNRNLIDPNGSGYPNPDDQWQKKPRLVLKNPNQEQRILQKSLRGRMSRQYQSNDSPSKDKLMTLSKLEYYLKEENRKENIIGLQKSPSDYEREEYERGGARLLPGKSSKTIMRKISLDHKKSIDQELFRETSSKKLIKSILDTNQYRKPPIGKKDPLDEKFYNSLVSIKHQNPLVALMSKNKDYKPSSRLNQTEIISKNTLNVPPTNKSNPIYSHDIADKLMLLDRIEKTMHQKLDSKMLPDEKKFTYFDSISPMKNGQRGGSSHPSASRREKDHSSFGGKFIRFKVGGDNNEGK
ncbi:UNKNOWN [Stylonychia lemnae]|uniref:Uncharacterized protein n=1 Tax=Stylonychia lemnae TaxID=5949 RepID=A0A078A8B1_STYLE|nr:UNKNOWN [Stylonychia lemnae]|eukprot:CDW77812.1 UNKNOWN [Stylonychia lemnae]